MTIIMHEITDFVQFADTNLNKIWEVDNFRSISRRFSYKVSIFRDLFVTYRFGSNGKKIPGRKRKLDRQKERQRKLRVNARKGSKQKTKTKGSNSYKKALKLHSKECQTVKERELSFMHMHTSAIVSKYPNLVIEELRITNMVKNKKLARRKLEPSWGTFKRLLEYKAVSAGGSSHKRIS